MKLWAKLAILSALAVFLVGMEINSQLVNAFLERLASDPTGTEARIYWNTTDDVAKIHNGTSFVDILVTGDALSNPMDSEGDLIYGGASGAATKLDSGSTGQALVSNGAAAPSWKSDLQLGTSLTMPSDLWTSVGALTVGYGLFYTGGSFGTYWNWNWYRSSGANTYVGLGINSVTSVSGIEQYDGDIIFRAQDSFTAGATLPTEIAKIDATEASFSVTGSGGIRTNKVTIQNDVILTRAAAGSGTSCETACQALSPPAGCVRGFSTSGNASRDCTDTSTTKRCLCVGDGT